MTSHGHYEPCPRAGQPKCEGRIWQSSGRSAVRKYCSKPCGYEACAAFNREMNRIYRRIYRQQKAKA